jgi:hypothetical protein
MKKIILFFLFLFSQMAFAQRFTLRGTVVDSASKPLEMATVTLLSVKDSSLISFERTNETGFFEIKNIPSASYLLKITYVEYKPFARVISPTSEVLDMGKIQMKSSSVLDEVVVKAEKPPVTVKRDTIEFNAGSFKVKPNGNVEDLLKKLPGVQVERDGTVKVQGEEVKRVMVDGKEFFGTDPKLATRNLPADAIESVEMFDKKSDQTVFSGIDDGQREKTINLKLKEKNKKGMFGNAMAGAGTNERFETKLSLNRFSKKRQFSLLEMGNNTNQQGFSPSEYLSFSGDLQRMASGGGGTVTINGGGGSSGVPLNFGGRTYGFMRSWAGGLNYNEKLSNKTDLQSNYFLNAIKHDVASDLTRENFTPKGNNTLKQNTLQNNTNTTHRLNLTLDHKIDSLNSLKLTSNITYSETESNVRSNSRSLNSANDTINDGNRVSLSEGSNVTVNSNLLFRHRFRKKGRTLSVNALFTVNDKKTTGTLNTITNFYQPKDSTYIQNQTNGQTTDSYSYGATINYTEPIGKRKYLEVAYNFRQTNNRVNRDVYDWINNESFFNSNLSNKYNNDYTYHRPGVSFRINQKKYTISAGANLQASSLNGELITTNTIVDKTFTNVLPNLRFNYDFAQSKRLRFDYETSVQEPTISQLNPFVDKSDPLNISTGNPDLRPEYKHNWRLNYFSFDPGKFINFFGRVNASYTSNNIVTSQTTDENLVRTSKPVNLGENFTLSSNFNFGFPVKKLNSRFNLGTGGDYSKGLNLLNGVSNHLTQKTLSGTFRYDYTLKEIIDLGLSANLSRQFTEYELSTAANQTIDNQTYAADLNITLPKGFQLGTSFDYMFYQSKSNNFSQQIPIWNASISKFILKNKAGELKIAGVNLLDRAIGVNQRAQVNYIEQERITSLGRYFMISFTYVLNKALNPMNGRGNGNRNFRMMGPGPGPGGRP